MSKLVVLKLKGNLSQHGFKVALEISEEGQLPDVDLWGELPPNTRLANTLQDHWLNKYRTVGAPYTQKFPYRIEPKNVIYTGYLNRVQECQQSALQLEQQFQDWLKSATFQPIDLQLREELHKDEDIRLLVRSDDRDIKKLPWHLWEFCRRYTRSEVAFGALNAVKLKKVRRLPNATVRILAVLGHREGIDIDRDRQFLEKLPQAEVTFLVEPHLQDINNLLWEQTWDIIFFAGHSETEGDAGKIYINSEESLEIQELRYALQKAIDRGLKLAIFNSCDGLGLVRGWDNYEIPVAIVMRELVPDKVAHEFLKHFLDRFVSGMPFHLAVREAREWLQGLEKEYPCATWLPVICQSSTDALPRWENLVTATAGGDRNFFVSIRERKFKLLAGLVAALSIQFLGLPSLSKYLNARGQKYLMQVMQEPRSWVIAKFHFQAALFFNPKQPAANNNLGLMYDDMGKYDTARSYYDRAHQLHSAVGCNNKANLDIRQGEYDRASQLLRQCKWLLHSDDPLTRYSILKNQGWAALELGRYNEATDYLEEAVQLFPKEGAASCLLALTLEETGTPELSVDHWQNCLQYARPYYPEEEEWQKQAQYRLEARGERQP